MPQASLPTRPAITPSPAPSVQARYRRNQILGLVILAVAVLVWALLRADPHAIFPPGWWRF